MADKADRVRGMFASIARAYDLNNRLHSFLRDQAWRRMAVDLAEVGRSDRILDVACGTGDLTEAFADARPAGVTGVDFTEPMLEIARRKSQQRRRPRGAPAPEYVRGDAKDLPVEDESFDIVSIAFGIRNVDDPHRALRELRRVLRPGGRLVILEFSEPGNLVLRLLNRFYSRCVLPITATLIARDRTGAYRYLPRSIAMFLDPAELAEAMRAAGFEVTAQRALTFGVCTISVGRVPE